MSALAAVPMAELPAFVRSRYTLRPDRRLLGALAAVDHIVQGSAPKVVLAEPRDGGWRILADGEEVGTLGEFPTFEEAAALLARRAGRAATVSDPAAADASAALLEALGELDGGRVLAAIAAPGADPSTVAKGLAWLATFVVDRLEQGDPLFAEAWARVAIAGDTRDEVLVARALGYQAAAARAAGKLAAGDPVRLFANGDEAGLAKACAGADEGATCSYLRLALLAERDQDERFAEAKAQLPGNQRSSPAVIGLETRLTAFDGGAAGDRLSHDALLSLGLVKTAFGSTARADAEGPESRAAELEAAVERLAAPAGGSFEVAAIKAWHRANFYSGLYGPVHFALDQLASDVAARKRAELLAGSAAGTTAAELRRYSEVRGAVLGGSRDLRPVAALLAGAKSLGAAQLHELAEIVRKKSQSTEPVRRQPIPAVFARLDTRPAHRVVAARLVRYNLNSPGLYEKLVRAAAEAAPYGSEELPALAAELDEDAARLRLIAADPAMPSYAQVVALFALEQLGRADDAFVRSRYEEMARDPGGSSQWLLAFLEKRGELAAAVSALDAALSRRRDAFDEAYLRTEKARLQRLLGEPAKAFATLEPALRVGKEDTSLEGARIELARGRPAEALELARAALWRYPDDASETAGLIARARWRLGDGATAAKELAADPGGILEPWNGQLGEAIAQEYHAAPAAEVKRVFAELKAAGVPDRALASAAIALGYRRDAATALDLLAGLDDMPPEWQDQLRLQTYDLVRSQEGRAAAIAWIRRETPNPSHNYAMTLYQDRRYELLLGLFADGAGSGNAQVTRLVQAASLMHLGETSGPRWEALTAAVAKDGEGEFPVLTRLLMDGGDGLGQLPELGNDDLASVGWLMGVKAATAGRYDEADGWFQVALESELDKQPPHAWSWAVESDWIHTRRSLELLARRGIFRPDFAGDKDPEAKAEADPTP